MTYRGRIDPHETLPTLTTLWDAEDTCRVGFNIRIAKFKENQWVVIERHGPLLTQADQPHYTFQSALRATQGKTLKEDRK